MHKALIICDSQTFLLEKVAKEKNIFIEEIIAFMPECEKQIITKPKNILLLISEIFYKELEKRNTDIFDLNNLKNELILIDSLIKYSSDLGSQIYIPFIPKHFIYCDRFGASLIDKNSKNLAIQNLNYSLFKKYNDLPNVNFLNGLEELSEEISKSYFRFSSIYDKKNSNIILDQFLEHQKYLKLKKKKLIILDLDNTLWKGILGDDSIEGIRMDNSDPIGSIFKTAQNIFLQLKDNGFLLALCSKNNEQLALKALFENPASLFKSSDIVTYRINWEPKSKNIKDICDELNISLLDTIFIDDNEYECDEVRANCNGISIIKVPKNIYKYPFILATNSLFHLGDISNEDKIRTEMYKNNLKRKNIFENVKETNGTRKDWIKSLEIKLTLNKISKKSKNFDRIIQLFNRTNQFNLAGSKYNKFSFSEVLNQTNIKYIYGSVTDRIGSEGLISVIGFYYDGQKILVKDFILSCRVFGRYIEESMLILLFDYAISKHCDVYFDFVENERNLVIKEFISKITLKDFHIPIERIIKFKSDFSNLPISIINETNF